MTLKPGWLAQQMRDIEALSRAHKKIVRADDKARSDGPTQQPVDIKFTIPELRALAYMVRVFER